MVVADGLNDHEIGAVADFAFGTDYIAGVAYQPVFGSGRANPIDPTRRMTTTGVLKHSEHGGDRAAEGESVGRRQPDCGRRRAVGCADRDDERPPRSPGRS